MYTFIYSEEELHKFFDVVLPPLTDNEVYFVSLSARKKYLSDETKSILDGSSEMFERKLIEKKDWNLFLRTIRRYECNDGAYMSLEGEAYPNAAMMIYLNFNPCDVIKAYEEFIMDSTRNMMALALGRGSSPDYFKRIQHNLMTAMHHSRGTKHYVDIDIDFFEGTKNTSEGNKAICSITEFLKSKNVKFFLVNSHSGYHILMKVETLYFGYMKELTKFWKKDIIQDIMNNSQGMLQLPGTLAGGKPIAVEYSLSNY
jgi:hypothetical protein